MLLGSSRYLTIPGGPSLLKISLSPRFSGFQFATGLLRSFSVLRHIVSGSEMIWLVSLVSDRPSCSSFLWNEWGLSTRLWAFVEMNVVVFTSKVLLSWGRTFFPGLGAYCLRCSTERTLSGRSVSPAAVQFLLFHRFVSKRHNPFVNYFCMFCSKKLLPFVIKSDSWATWGKPCLWR